MTPRPQPDDVEARVWAFEAAFADGAKPDLAAFLPDPGQAHFLAVLRELACVDLERAAGRGERRSAVDYLERFPALAADPEAVAALTREEARATGAAVVAPPVSSQAADWRVAAAALYADYRDRPSDGTAVVDSLELADLLLESGPVEPPVPLPQPGDALLGFHLVRELGRGAFGRVFLAEQTDLAARPVALKIGTMLFDESRALAQLQHTNVVPIYSAHRAGRLQALCMPYLGATTLADVITERRRGAVGNVVLSTLAARAAPTMKADAPPDGTPPEPPRAAPAALEVLRGMSHPRTVAWVGARLADGLAHAHERGILHRDIKPANVLIADDGTPLLLDFNLSGGAGGSVPAALGGTLPYMAPEHLEAFRGGAAPVDERSDIYALGVVLFELLTGRHPFPSHKGPLREQVPQMAADRRDAPPRASNPPGLNAILTKCLAPNPHDRYQTARGLHEDLQRQFEDRPLAYAHEPLGIARGAKFVRRNRRALVVAAVAVLALGLAAVGALFTAQSRRAARAEALAELAAFREEARDAGVPLSLPALEHAAEGSRVGRLALARFGLPDRADWDRARPFAALPPAEQDEVRAAAARLLLMLASGEAVSARSASDPAARLRDAKALSTRAAEVGGEPVRRAADLQRGLLETGVWRPGGVARLFGPERDSPLLALEAATRAEPGHTALWADRGVTALAYARPNDAVASFSAVLALRPNLWQTLVWRGRAYHEADDFPRARADLDAALARAPDDVPALVLRGLTLFKLEQHAAAEADLTRALELGATATRVYFIRAQVRAARKDAAGAAADRAEGLKRTPTDEVSWVARGVARQATDPKGAVADFAEALKLNPLSREAAQNTAATLSEYLGKPAEAVAALDKLLGPFPDFVDARVGRAVLLARLGKRDAAHADAVAALKLDRTGPTLYRAGCAYALTAKAHPGDRAEAFKLITAALLDGFGAVYVPIDDDLAPLKADAPEFARLLKLAAETKSKK